MRTGVSRSAARCQKRGAYRPGARDIADKLLASLSQILLLLVSLDSHNGERIQPETDDDSIGGHFLHLLHGEKPSQSWEKGDAYLAGAVRRTRV